MITAKSMIGRPTFYAPNYVNVWFARENCPQIRFNEVTLQKVEKSTGHAIAGSKIRSVQNSLQRENDVVCKKSERPFILNVNGQLDDQSFSVSAQSPRQADSIKVDLDSYLGQKSHKQASTKPLHHKRKYRKQEKWKQSVTENSHIDSTHPKADKQYRPKRVQDVLEVIENRKKSIKAKLLIRKEHLLTQEEEQDIHTRADLYAITTIPDTKYCILPSEDCVPRAVFRYEDPPESIYPPARKKRRRNYGNTSCYVTFHNEEDMFDNTKMLPIGTRLVKPPTKLVELVAQAISGSPDGLLQVQQIYTFLQNKYPFFRYMDRVAINSWRSSIRHALYQKWFRKIRFDSSFISSKGCYWAINNKSNPKEWSLPDNKLNLETIESHLSVESLQYLSDEQETQEVAAIARHLLSAEDCPSEMSESLDCLDQQLPTTEPQNTVPSPVKEPDPILSTCTTDWNNDDICISSNESGHGTMTPVNSPSFQTVLCLTQEQNECDIRADLILGSPLNSLPNADLISVKDYSPRHKTVLFPCQKLTKTDISPMVNWTPDWEEYGSYIISPQNVNTQKYVQNLPGDPTTATDCDNNETKSEEDDAKRLELQTMCSLLDSDSEECSPLLNCSCGSDTESCEFEVIAEFPKSDFPSPDLGLELYS
ncbi:uncharacterized protein LOC132753137 [Ruditapes philippinarum]|uniref:uncharacterized protein LOC132753137 n=1 Tax=Ruditapes philippinarum TaxID=129788 RepID=UPI00295B3325|nr:uncharacterized protein LOC132753137 [Ruditapes philippinarum]